MAPTASPQLVGQTLLWIMLTAVTCIIILTAIAYFSYKHTEIFYNNVRLGHVYLFDAMTKYKKTIVYALMFLLFIVTVSFYK
jgi:hypothetical protein